MVNLDPLHHRPYDTTLGLPAQMIQGVGHGRGEVVQMADNQPQIALRRRLLGKVFRLRFEDHHALLEARHAGLEFALLDEPLGVAVDQAPDPLSQLADLGLGGHEVGLVRLLPRIVQTPLILLDQPLRVFQQAAHLRPHGQVHQIGPDLRVVAEPMTTKAVGVAADAAVVRVMARVMLGRARADLFAIVRIAAPGAADQSLQEVARPALPLPRPLTILL